MKSLITIVFYLLYMAGTVYGSNGISINASINGKIQYRPLNPDTQVRSENGIFGARYDILLAGDEIRKLTHLRVYKEQQLLFTLNDLPGSDLQISNSGYLLFYDHQQHFRNVLKIHVYSPAGHYLFTKDFTGASLFVLSEQGNFLGVRTPKGISVIPLDGSEEYLIEKGLQLTIAEMPGHDVLIAVASMDKIYIYSKSTLLHTFDHNLNLPRALALSVADNKVAVTDKYTLKVFSREGKLHFADKIHKPLAFRDLKITAGKILCGIHKKTPQESAGIIRAYDFNSLILGEESGDTKNIEDYRSGGFQKSTHDPAKIPWPFFPFDSMRIVWNHYEQHMGLGGASSYLHQGLDLIIPIGEPTYSVLDGYVKLVLTIGGASYWRIAVSREQNNSISSGWLSAHLIESTIQFDIGDTVQIHDYLGDIVQWTAEWGHIHFVEIEDSGQVWYYDDDEWGINFNPSLALQPYPDITPPSISPVFKGSKFAFARNETDSYLSPDSLFGEVDIIVKAVDYIGYSPWQQPAYSTWYTIKRISDGQIIKPKIMGHILNHRYDFYSSANYMPYAQVIYQVDSTLLPTIWMSEERNYYHNLTNSNGDSLVELWEKSLALSTTDFANGNYRIIVEVYDEAGNGAVDSMDVTFNNTPVADLKDNKRPDYNFKLQQNYPNPFNPKTIINYQLSITGDIDLSVYNLLGQKISTLVNGYQAAGEYKVEFDASELSSGIYYYRLTLHPSPFAGKTIVPGQQIRKMVLLK